MTATVHRINVSAGGVPKTPVAEARVTRRGIEGDAQAKPGIHGGPYRAVSLFALERIDALAAEGHPIAPGSTGENVTVRGLDWERLTPGARLRLGAEVVLRVTSFAAPCDTIADSFSDGKVSRLNARRHPGWSRLYTEVLAEGVLRAGDTVTVEGTDQPATAPIGEEAAVRSIAQVAIPVSDLGRSIVFYRDVVGAAFTHRVDPPGLAFLRAGSVGLMLDGPGHSGGAKPNAAVVYFDVADIDASYQAMSERGAVFDAPPLRQYAFDGVEGWLAFFADPDGNPLALQELRRV